jgi:DedD protein
MEQQLKQRLIGAVVLVSLAVIFIPVILEGPDDEWSPRDHTIPEPPRVDFRAAMELPLPEAQPDEEIAPSVVAEQPGVEPEAAAAPDEEPPGKPQLQPAPETQPAAEVNELEPGWYAQVGSFSQPANAEGLRDSINKAGFTAHLQQVASTKGTSYRVLVGPQPTREGAGQLLEKLGKTLKTTGIVIGIDTPE